MKNSAGIAVILSVLGVCAPTQTVWADAAQATCEFYKHGDQKHDRWGACSFSQRQGYIDITLKNGNIYNLSPQSEANHFTDQKGHKVVRTQSSSNQVYEWDNDDQKLVVNFNKNSAGKEAAPAASNSDTAPSAAVSACNKFAEHGYDGTIMSQSAMKPGWWEIVLRFEENRYVCNVSSDGKVDSFDILK